ncbi:MAG: cation efflux protein, CzcI family [Pseudomonadota bacterium]
MRRWLTLLLVLVLPIQFTWAVAAPYCQHEKAASVRHFGHHAHDHEATASTAEQKAGKPAGLAYVDHDCGFCHLGAAQPVPMQSIGLMLEAGADRHEATTRSWRTRDPDRLERPNWPAA